MSKTPNGDYQRRARIGIGASIGTIFGAGVAELLFDGAHFVIIGLTIGAALGAVVGTQLKSESFQYIWIEYSKDISRRLWLAGGLFLTPFSLYIFLLKNRSVPAIEIMALFMTIIGGFYLIFSAGRVIFQLDDLLRKILLEAIAVGFGLSLVIFLFFGLLSLAYPIPANWLIAFIIMLASMLLGRFLTAAKYR